MPKTYRWLFLPFLIILASIVVIFIIDLPFSSATNQEQSFSLGLSSVIQGKIIDSTNTPISEARVRIVGVSITNVNAGHRLPTGVSFRNIILLVSAEDTTGTPFKFVKGSRVPDWGGNGSYTDGNYAGHPGKGFAKILDDAEGNQPVQDWQAVRVDSDNRIMPKETDTSVYRFELSPNSSGGIVAIKLIYRRAFKPLADAKNWKLEDIVMREREISF